MYVQPGTGNLQTQFSINLNSCGMTSSSSTANYGQPTPSGTFIENTIIIQYDPLVQEVGSSETILYELTSEYSWLNEKVLDIERCI